MNGCPSGGAIPELTRVFSVHMTALARVKRRCRIALDFSRRSARPETWVNLQRRGVDALRVPRRGNHPEQLPLWEPNGVNPAGSGTPSGWRSRLVLKIEGATNTYGLEMGRYDPGLP